MKTEVLCKGEECSPARDAETCCVDRASCQNFAFGCAQGQVVDPTATCKSEVCNLEADAEQCCITGPVTTTSTTMTSTTMTVTTSTLTTMTSTTTYVEPIVIVLREMGVGGDKAEHGPRLALHWVAAVALLGALAAAAVGASRCVRQRRSSREGFRQLELSSMGHSEDVEDGGLAASFKRAPRVAPTIHIRPERPAPPLVVKRDPTSPQHTRVVASLVSATGNGSVWYPASPPRSPLSSSVQSRDLLLSRAFTS